MVGLLRSEWLKLRSVRSTWWTLAVAGSGVLIAAALAWWSAGYWDGASAEARRHFVLSPTAPLVGWLAQLCLAVLGVLAITSEHATGTIFGSLAAVPRRWTLLSAKATVVGAVALVAGEAIVLASFLASRAIIGDRPLRYWTAPVSQEVPVLLSWGLSVMVFALVGLGVGAVVRSTAGAIVSLVVVWYVAPIVALHLGAPWDERVSSALLSNLPAELSGAPALSGAGHAALSPAGALAAMAGYLVVALGAAGVALSRRDP